MISYLYNNDLESINNMITEINNSLSKVDNSTTVASQKSDTGQIVGVDSPCTEIVLDGLDIKEKAYGFNLKLYNSSANNYYLFLNNDKKSTSYRYVRSYADGTTVGSSFASDSLIINTSANDSVNINGVINVTPDNKYVLVNFSGHRSVSELIFFTCIKYTISTEQTNIFKIVINSDVENAIIKNSSISIWRLF